MAIRLGSAGAKLRECWWALSRCWRGAAISPAGRIITLSGLAFLAAWFSVDNLSLSALQKFAIGGTFLVTGALLGTAIEMAQNSPSFGGAGGFASIAVGACMAYAGLLTFFCAAEDFASGY